MILSCAPHVSSPPVCAPQVFPGPHQGPAFRLTLLLQQNPNSGYLGGAGTEEAPPRRPPCAPIQAGHNLSPFQAPVQSPTNSPSTISCPHPLQRPTWGVGTLFPALQAWGSCYSKPPQLPPGPLIIPSPCHVLRYVCMFYVHMCVLCV